MAACHTATSELFIS